MLELPEASVTAQQINNTLRGKRIKSVLAGHTPHKFAWYAGDPGKYSDLLTGKPIGKATVYGGMVEIEVDDATMLFGDGAVITFHEKNKPRPQKHQLLVEFADSTALSGSVQMYGGLWCFKTGTFENPYYQQAKEKPSPLSSDFDEAYFDHLISIPEAQKLSLKALLATEQRIPGLGNGVLQDILFDAKMHPKKKVNTLSDVDREFLYKTIKSTLSEMAAQGGRDTEKDLFGEPGGYVTRLSRNSAGKPCPLCGTIIKKEAYMGGSIYYCETCQTV